MSDRAAHGGAHVWINGEHRSGPAAAVSARDRGFTLGDGVFETMRLRRGHVFRLPAHRARLIRGLATLEIPVPPELDDWIASAVDAFEVAPDACDAAVRVTVTRGEGPPGLLPSATPRPTVVVSVGPPPVVSPEIYQRGLSAMVARGRRNERAMTAGLKTTAYADAVVALLDARRAGAEEAIFLDTTGRCSEATASNLFIWSSRRLVTPSLSCGALPGITRAAVLELAPTQSLAAAEEAFDLETLHAADEAFLTSALRGIVPLVRLDGRAIGTGTPGERTCQLMDAYEALVDAECPHRMPPSQPPGGTRR